MRAPTEVFVDHSVVRSSDLDDARAGLTEAFLPVELSVRHTPASVDVRLNVVKVGRITVGYLRFGDAVRILTAEAVNYHVDIPVSGSMVARTGLRNPVYSNPRTAAVFMPFLPADIDCDSECAQLCLMLARTDLQVELENLLGRPIASPLDFATAFDLTDPCGAAFVQLLHVVDLESRRPDGLLGHRLAVQRLEQMLIDALIFGQRHNYSDAIRAGQPTAGVRPVSRAVELLRRRAGRGDLSQHSQPAGRFSPLHGHVTDGVSTRIAPACRSPRTRARRAWLGHGHRGGGTLGFRAPR